ncbi:MAG TPA: response regulator [Balneolales bacterium]|nr:response regulator [Balneolales bacterium]
MNNNNSLLVPSQKNRPIISFHVWNNNNEKHASNEKSGFSKKNSYTGGKGSNEFEHYNNSQNLVHILHVEDNQQLRLITKFLLSNVCEVDNASSPEETEQKILKKSYDLIMMDLDLGNGLDGLDLSRKIRSMAKYKHTPILALTANNDPIVKAKCRLAGINAYIEKPFLKSDIISIIENLTRNNF